MHIMIIVFGRGRSDGMGRRLPPHTCTRTFSAYVWGVSSRSILAHAVGHMHGGLAVRAMAVVGVPCGVPVAPAANMYKSTGYY
jgi:hypothetical protein